MKKLFSKKKQEVEEDPQVENLDYIQNTSNVRPNKLPPIEKQQVNLENNVIINNSQDENQSLKQDQEPGITKEEKHIEIQQDEAPKKKLFGGFKKKLINDNDNQNKNQEEEVSNITKPNAKQEADSKTQPKPLKQNTSKPLFKLSKLLKRKIIAPRLIYAIFIFAFGFYSLSLSVVSFVQMKSMNFDFSQIQRNLQSDPIISLRDPGQGNSCYNQEESIFNYKWLGTKTGCSCLGVKQSRLSANGLNSQVYEGNCNDAMKRATCSQLSANSPQNLSSWDKNGGAFLICATRLKGYNFADKSPQDQHCDDLKKCNPQYPETMYCVPDTVNCPINSIVISQTNPNPLIYDLSDSIELNSTHSLWVTTQANNLPITEFQIQEGNGVCKDQKPNITPGREEYILIQTKRNPCQDTDNRYNQLIQIGELTLFQNNPIINIINNLPGYNSNDNYIYNHYFRHYLPWKMPFRQYIQKFINYSSVLQQKTRLSIAIMAFCSFLCLLTSLFFVVLEIYNIFDKDIPCMSGDTSDFSIRVKSFKRLYNFLPKLINYILMILLFSYSTAIQQFFQLLASAQPSDDITNSYLQYLFDTYQKNVYIYDLQLVVIHLAVFIIDFIRFGTYAITSLFEKPESKKTQEEKQQEQKDNLINIFTQQKQHSFVI